MDEFLSPGYSRTGSFASTELELLLGTPGPALFTLTTLNSYSMSSTNPSTVYLVSYGRRQEQSMKWLFRLYRNAAMKCPVPQYTTVGLHSILGAEASMVLTAV